MAKRKIKKAAKKGPARKVAKGDGTMAALRAMYDAYNDKTMSDAKRTAAIFAPVGDKCLLVEHAPPDRLEWGGKFIGKQGWQEFFGRVGKALEHKNYVCQHMHQSGDWVFSWGYFDSVCRQSGKQTRREWQHRLLIRNGKIVEMHEFYDTLQMAIDLGRA